jgi:hypothetical protein
MSTFQIDFFELAFLAESCIPPRPIARMYFWQNLTDRYWEQMSDPERHHIWTWLQKNPWYEESLAKEEETQIFHARFDPDNQYMVKFIYNNESGEKRAFKMGDRYYTKRNQWISEEYITEVTKFNPKTEY